ncbi:MAG: carbohydrate-binding family 9-like protein [Ferruginibacter sp.]
MKQVTARHLAFSKEDILSGNAATVFNNLEKHKLNYAPWPLFSYAPDVYFSIAYNSTFIYLKYFVAEKELRAVNTEINSDVWEDSCVEFFIKFSNDDCYYNFEFNCIGTLLVGWGKAKEGRILLDAVVVKEVVIHAQILSREQGNVKWELTAAIPISIFKGSRVDNFESGNACMANFYKCGDKLKDPHFLTWSPVESAVPDFHLPRFFGKMVFE